MPQAFAVTPKEEMGECLSLMDRATEILQRMSGRFNVDCHQRQAVCQLHQAAEKVRSQCKAVHGELR
jgi:hypothetical protein